ncbi:hypothetical protein PHYBOEH_003161 [Phytophthora boehmeriae]|uniref:C2 domain-containing protein n=1 Tax=Phytophthora boehmeriae TaxID=109152 RepID=A0A8T1WT36_9STRA|nr:hypothetical protein PHYBOEH_003161 [Phytophthora boehmeriae]
MTDTAVNEALVVRIQTLFRARRARREAVELANSAYLKCWDSVTGFAYYCNLRTGLASWKKPLLLAGRDRVEIPVNDTNPLQDEVETNSEPVVDDSQTRLSLKERQQRRDESLVFQQKCATEKQELMIQHRRKVARAMRRFEKRMMDEKRRARVERQEKLKNDNQQLLQELYEGKKKENVETIREAAMRGHVDRIENLLDMGFSADAESAMGLTPLLASCQSGHLDVVKKLLARVPIALRSPPDQLPQELESEWSLLQQNLKRLCEQLQAAESNEHFDTACCVSKDASGASLATLDICVEQAENLPFRDPRIGDMVDPFVRVFLRSSIKKNGADLIESDARIGDRNPVWSFQCQITAVPSIQHELSVQVMDAKRQDVAGETSIPLRSLLDQKDHDDWHIMPPTLRQQLLEKHPREQSARIRICVRFTHTKVVEHLMIYMCTTCV